MIIDSRLQVSSDQAFDTTGAVVSEDIIPIGASRIIGPGDPMWWVIVAKADLGGDTPTLDIDVETDTVEGFGSATTLMSYPQLAAADFTRGTTIIIPMPFNNEGFVRLKYTFGTSSGNATCTIDAWLTNQDPTKWSAQPNAI